MDPTSSIPAGSTAAFLKPALCAGMTDKDGGKQSQCPNSASQICSACKLVQYCSKKCQVASWPDHKKICKSDLMGTRYIPAWIKENRPPHWISDTSDQTIFGVNQYLWGNMPAVDIVNMKDNEGADGKHCDMNLLFAASGDIRNVVKSVTEGLQDGYDGKCTIVINDLNSMVVARNAILLLIAFSLEAEEAAITMLHVWYSALLPHGMVDTLRHSVLPLIVDVCDKIKHKSSLSLRAKTFWFGERSLRLVLKKQQWDELKGYFDVPQSLTGDTAQDIRRLCMLAPQRTDYLHRQLCNQPAPFRVATVTFREDGLLLPHGASREEFDMPNPTLFHSDLVWPMKDDASPLGGWDYHCYKTFARQASNDVMGSLFYFLTDTLLRFCKRVKEIRINFCLLNVDARVLPSYLDAENSQFDRIEVSNICDRGYVGPEKTLSTFGPLLAPRTVNPKATLVMLFINAVSEVYHSNGKESERSRFKESMSLINNFIPMTPETALSMMTDAGTHSMRTPEMIRMSSCYTMFGDFDKAFDTFSRHVRMNNLTRTYGMKIKDKMTIIEPWPLRVTEKTTAEEFMIRCADLNLGSERYMEFERC